MLTATYTLVALSVEHANVRSNLQALQKLLHSSFIDQSHLSPAQIGQAVDAVKRLYENCHWRKIDMFLVPALRNANEHANGVLRELDDLARTVADAVGATAARMGSAAIDSQASVAQFCAAIETFCSASLQRLEREENELYPLARALISGETWFSIANKMMAHDAYVQDSKPVRPSTGHQSARAPAPALPPAPPHVRPARPAPGVDARSEQARHLAFLAT